MGNVAQHAMLALFFAYALLGLITFAVMLSVVNLADEPDQSVTPECFVLVVALWPLFAIKWISQLAMVAADELRGLAQRLTSVRSVATRRQLPRPVRTQA